MLGMFLLKDSISGFVRWMRANGGVSPDSSKLCADFLLEWCRACPELTRADEDELEDEQSESGSEAEAGPSAATVPLLPPLPPLPPTPPLPPIRTSSLSRAASGNIAGPWVPGLGTGSSVVGAGLSDVAAASSTSSTPVSVAANSCIETRYAANQNGR